MLTFAKRHWKTIVGVLIAVVLLIVVLTVVLPAATGNNTQLVGKTGIVKVDGNDIGVFDTVEEAKSNPITLDAGTRKVEVFGDGEKVAEATTDGFLGNLLTQDGENYLLNTTDFGNETTINVKVMVGGDGSWIGQRLSDEVNTYYFTISVNNPDQSPSEDPKIKTSKTLGVPNGTVLIDGSSFPTYGSESEAQKAVAGKKNQFTLPQQFVTNGLPITVNPSTDNTVRVVIHVSMVDSDYTPLGKSEVVASGQNNWTVNMDLSRFAGHQVTLMLKAEDGWAVNNGFSYISFFLPEATTGPATTGPATTTPTTTTPTTTTPTTTTPTTTTPATTGPTT